jgi:RHS repeat-associated protein
VEYFIDQIEQVNHYYPFGGLMGESTNDEVQRYKYNGKELDRMHGLNLYDYHARQYDAALGQFTTMDPLSEKYYHISPYAYCLNNPIRLTDPTGMKPDSLEAAFIADHIYGRNDELIGGWQLYYKNSTLNGLQYGLYEREMASGKMEYVLAFAGTNDMRDVKQDICQFMDSEAASQYGNAVSLGRKFSSFYNGYEKTIVGHSLGGGLATAAALTTGIPAITFNPAAMTEKTKSQLSVQDAPANNITNYVVFGEPLSFIQNIFGIHLPGNTIYLDAPKSSSVSFINSVKAHRVSTIKKILSK